MTLVCQECGTRFEVDLDATPDPECPTCGSTDYEVD